MSLNDPIVRFPEMLAMTGLPRSTVYAEIAKGRFPAPIKITARRIGWLKSELEAWRQKRTSERPVPPTPAPEDELVNRKSKRMVKKRVVKKRRAA